MSSKYIDNGAYATSGYTLSGVFQSITIGASGSIGGPGLVGGNNEAYTIVNGGRLTSSVTYGSAIYLHDGGSITNNTGGLIEGGNGIRFHTAPGDLVNAGTVEATANSGFAFYSLAGGSVSNSGTIEATGAGGIGVVLNAGTVTNDTGGTISGSTNGIYAAYGGVVTNDANARIAAGTGYGIDFGRPTETASIVNNGRILGGTLSNGSLAGVFVYDGGSLTNGAGSFIGGDVAARRGVLSIVNNGTITGGVLDGRVSDPMRPGAGTVANSGTIGGVYLGGGGTVTNSGSTAFIGGFGITIAASPGMVVNAGSIRATGTESVGVALTQGYIVNRAGALIDGSFGIVISTGGATVMNEGLIQSDNVDPPAGGITTYKFGVYLGGGGNATNTASGTIQTAGYYDFGIGLKTAGTATNDGTIIGVGGVLLKDGGTVVNAAGAKLARVIDPVGLATIDNAGSILGGEFIGIKLLTGGAVTNSVDGLISGATGISFRGPGTIVNFGRVTGSAGTAIYFQSTGDTLIEEAGSSNIGEIVGDQGTLDLVGTAGTVSNFEGFALVDLTAGETWTASGTNTIASGTTSSALDNGLLIVTSTATIAGTVSGTGTLKLEGVANLASGAHLSVAHLIQSSGTVTVAKSLTYAGGFTKSGGMTALAGQFLTLTGAAAFTGGTISGPGYLQTEAAASLASLYLNGGAIWQDFGTVTQTGSLVLGGSGNSYAKLVIETGGVFDITGNGGIALAAGGGANIVNAALLEKTGSSGTSTISVAVNNAGTIAVATGTLDLAAGLAGSGSARIGTGATLALGGTVASTETIAFAGSNARLVLSDVPAFRAAIDTFDAGTSGDSVDVTTFGTGTSVSFSQPNTGETVATLKNGTRTATLTLFGQYSATAFGYTASSAGTVITYTAPAPLGALVPPHH